MLLRGQNLLGYKHYSDDIVDLFVRKSIENGIDIIRSFWCAKRRKKIETVVGKKENGHIQCAISYTTSPGSQWRILCTLLSKWEIWELIYMYKRYGWNPSSSGCI